MILSNFVISVIIGFCLGVAASEFVDYMGKKGDKDG